MTSRTPKKTNPKPKPPVKKSNPANTSVYLCQICGITDDVEKIHCDKCTLWYHFTCAQISADVLKRDSWICRKCTKKIAEVPVGNLVNVGTSESHVEPRMVVTTATKTNVTDNTSSKKPDALPGSQQIIKASTTSHSSKNNESLAHTGRTTAVPVGKVADNTNDMKSDTSSTSQRTITAPVTSHKIETTGHPIQPTLNQPSVSMLNTSSSTKGLETSRKAGSVSSARKAGSVSSAVSRRAALALQRLEEERQLREIRDNNARRLQDERDQEYLRQKYVILEDDTLSNLSYDEEELKTRRYEAVQEWTNSIPDLHFGDGQQPLHSTNVNENPMAINAPSEGDEQGAVGGTGPSLTKTDSLPSTLANICNLPDWLLYPKPVEVLTFPWENPSETNTSLSTSQGVDTGQRNINFDLPLLPISEPIQSHGPAAMSTITTSNQTCGGKQAASNQPQLRGDPNATLVQLTIADQTVMNGMSSYSGYAIDANLQPPVQMSQSTTIGLTTTPGVQIDQQQLSYNNPPATIRGNQPLSVGMSMSASQIQQTGASQTQSAIQHMSASQPPLTISQPPLTISQPPLTISQPPLTVSQPPLTVSQPPLTVSQPPLTDCQSAMLGASQTQLYGVSQLPLANQPSHLGQMSGTGQSFSGQPPSSNYQFPPASNYIPHASNSQLFSWNQSGQPYVSGQPPLNTSSAYQFPPASNTSVYVPISQPLSSSQNSYGSAGNQDAAMNVTITTRLTAEQIASRHVEKDLPEFNGDPRQWGLFISAYENANDSCGYSNSENLSRLKKSLKGEAFTNVRSLLLHKDSVPKVIATLRLLYGMPEHVVEATIADVKKLQPPKEDDLRSLIKYAMAIQNLSATIQSTGAVEHLRNPDLMSSIVEKLPTSHQVNWAFFKQTIGDASISHLGEWLYKIAEVVSRIVRGGSNTTRRNDNSDNNRKSKPEKPNLFVNSQMETRTEDKKSDNKKSDSKKSNSNKSDGSSSKSGGKRLCPACSNDKCIKLENCKIFRDVKREERWSIVKKANVCGRCLGYHKYFRCQADQKCLVEGCNMNHHTLLHKYEAASVGTSSNDTSKPREDPGSNRINNTCNSQHSESSHRTDKFRIVPVLLYNKNLKIRDYAYLDEGSNMTAMEDSLADELKLTGSSKELCVDWAFGQTHSVTNSRIVNAKISGYFDKAPCFNISNIRTVKSLHLPTQSITSGWLEQYPHFKNVPVTTYENVKPRILIGLQYSRLIASLETVEGNDDEPIVCRTRLGWVVQGPTYEKDGVNTQKHSLNMCVCQSNDNELHQLVKEYFTVEHLGIKVPENHLESKELQRAKNILESTTIKKGDRYEAGLLWKHDKVELPDSYNMALKRLICLESKMEKDPVLKDNLHKQIKQFVEKGYIRKLSASEVKNCEHPVWYLPTFPVFNPKKPHKVRLVWDGAAKVKGKSLNSELLVGPDELVPLPELLRRFRERKIAITGDLFEMYHQVKVRESDQHVQRFLWRDNTSVEPDVYVMMVMTFGSKCSPSTAQHVKNQNAKEFQAKYPRATEAIIRNHYVDDMIECTDTVDDAEKLVKDVKMIHRAGGFTIRNFASNSKELLEKIGEKVISESKDLSIGIELSKERVLGMFWETRSDTFTYSLKYTGVDERMLSGEHCPTKREVLRILMSVYDPLGLIAHFLVHGKILLQEIWRSKIDWDEKLTAELQHKWMNWIRMLPNVEKLHIPRWYSNKLAPGIQRSIQIHTFVDAGIEACAATVYLRIEDENGVDCCLVSAKTKVAPTKPLTVPRLELQAAVIGTRLADNVMKSQTLAIDKCVYWTDSQTVMAWINSETRRFNQFVSFRIGEILEATDPIQWRWVPTKHNVADEATKSKIIPTLDAKARWFKAPEFLYDDESSWFNQSDTFTTEEELRPCFAMSIKEIRQEQLVDLNRFSNWNRLLRTQAYVLRFVHNVKNAKEIRFIGPLSQEELSRAEIQLYRRAQRDAFMDEITILKHNEAARTQKSFERSSGLNNLSPYLDEHNVLRVRGRIDAAKSIPYDTKRPIILPRRHRVTHLLVDWYHKRYKHINHQTALNEIRQKYVIPAVRVVMKGIRTACQHCKNAAAMPRIPEMAELPPARLAIATRPFTFTGVDYFGPYFVKVNRSRVLKYGVLFTCLTTRAIHLEVADSLNTESCIEAIIRFAARKGMPKEFWSDNGTNFHGADNELKIEFAKMNKDAVTERFTSTESKWTFITPTASHMGGAWERLIQTVKNCLKQMLATKTPSYEMLVTLMAEVENIVNSRPLTYISLDSTDDEALTPNHFLFGSSNAMKSIGETTIRDLNRNDWRALQEMTKHFWHRFVLEYMPDLTKRTKWFKDMKPIKVGDVVINIDERYPKNTWPKGIVEEVFVAKDGRIRQVLVRFQKSVLKRPVSKLAILDLSPPNEEEVKLDRTTGPINGGKDVGQRCKDDNTDSTMRLPDGNKK